MTKSTLMYLGIAVLVVIAIYFGFFRKKKSAVSAPPSTSDGPAVNQDIYHAPGTDPSNTNTGK